jgi:hypothetical protein
VAASADGSRLPKGTAVWRRRGQATWSTACLHTARARPKCPRACLARGAATPAQKVEQATLAAEDGERVAIAHVELDHSSRVCVPFMNAKQEMKPPLRPSKSARAVRRAIAKSNPTKEPPTVGKPVIIDPVAPAKPNPAGSKPRERRKDEGDRH